MEGEGKFPEPTDPSDWQPATSRPGELFTPEGHIKEAGAVARGLSNDDPRLRQYRRPLVRTGLLILAAALVVTVIAVLISVATS